MHSAKGAVTVPSSCTSLHIDGDTSALDKYVLALEQHPALESLSLARDPRRARFEGGVSLDDLDDLLKVLPTTAITYLNLAFNRLGDEGLEVLANALPSTGITSLNIETASINTAGAVALAAAIKADKSRLTTVNLSNNNIGGAAEALIDAAKLSSKLEAIGDEGTELGRQEHFGGQTLRTLLKGECVATQWSAWSDCPGACGATGEVTRTRDHLHLPHKRHVADKSACATPLTEVKKCKVRCQNDASPPATLTYKPPAKRVPQVDETLLQEKPAPEASNLSPEAAVIESVAAASETASSEAAAATADSSNGPHKSDAAAADDNAPSQESDVGGSASEATANEVDAAPSSNEAADITTAAPSASSEDTAAIGEKTASYRTRLEAFYRAYNPSKLSTVDNMLKRYEDREEVLFNSLVSKYGPEP